MLTNERIKQIIDTESAKDCYAKPYSYGIAVARAIESAVRAEYADVPPEKFKALYRVTLKELHYNARHQTVAALAAIDNGTYNPKIGGEE